MATCSIQQIQITEADGSYNDSNEHSFLLKFGEQMDEEVSFTPNVLAQDSTAIDALAAVVRARGNKSQTISWSRTLTPDEGSSPTPAKSRAWIFEHIEKIPSNTIGARISYEDSPTSYLQTYRARVEAYPGSPTSGLDVTINYSLVWQFGTSDGGGAPPPSDYELLTAAGDRVYSPRGPQILMFH